MTPSAPVGDDFLVSRHLFLKPPAPGPPDRHQKLRPSVSKNTWNSSAKEAVVVEQTSGGGDDLMYS